MDDYSVASLSESKNEWCARLVNVLTTPIIEGLKSIFEESWNLCITQDEDDKYLMTFQTFLSRIPKWNDEIIKTEKKASTSFLQRKLQIGYNRAARIIEQMEDNGVVSKANHVGKREVL